MHLKKHGDSVLVTFRLPHYMYAYNLVSVQQSNFTSIHMRRQPSLSCIWGISKRLWQLSSRCNFKREMCAIIIRPNDHFAHYSRKDNLRVFAAEWAVVFGVLCHFHLLDNFTKSSTISGAVLPANSNLFSVISLWNSFEDIIINWTDTSNKIAHSDFCSSAPTIRLDSHHFK